MAVINSDDSGDVLCGIDLFVYEHSYDEEASDVYGVAIFDCSRNDTDDETTPDYPSSVNSSTRHNNTFTYILPVTALPSGLNYTAQ
jgi:hypothetical protein